MKDTKEFIEEIIPQMDSPEKVYELFHGLGYKTLDPSFDRISVECLNLVHQGGVIPLGARPFFKQVSHKAPPAHKEGGAFLFCPGEPNSSIVIHSRKERPYFQRRRVRKAARIKGLRYWVEEPHLPPGVLGIYAYRPVI